MSDVGEKIARELKSLTGVYRGAVMAGALAVLLLVALMAAMVFVPESPKADPEPTPALPSPTWTAVAEAMDRADTEGALALGEALMTKTPHYHLGHVRLARIYLARGDHAKAAEHYSRAYELYPAEDYRISLRLIRKGTPPKR